MSDRTLKILVIEPMKDAYAAEIDGSLDSLRKIVGGNIEATYPFLEPVAVVYNAEGKLLGLPFNRPLLDEHDLPYDILCGTFFVVGIGAERFSSLSDQQIRHYKKLFDRTRIITAEVKASEKSHQANKKKRGTQHER